MPPTSLLSNHLTAPSPTHLPSWNKTNPSRRAAISFPLGISASSYMGFWPATLAALVLFPATMAISHSRLSRKATPSGSKKTLRKSCCTHLEPTMSSEGRKQPSCRLSQPSCRTQPIIASFPIQNIQTLAPPHAADYHIQNTPSPPAYHHFTDPNSADSPLLHWGVSGLVLSSMAWLSLSLSLLHIATLCLPAAALCGVAKCRAASKERESTHASLNPKHSTLNPTFTLKPQTLNSKP